MKLCEECLLVDDVPENKLARYEVDVLSSPRIMDSAEKFTRIQYDNDNVLLNEKSTNNLKCVYSYEDGLHYGEVMIAFLDVEDEKYDEMFVKMLDDCGEENGVVTGKFTTISARRELINECLMKIEEYNLIATKIIIHPSLESKFKKALKAQDMDESYLVCSDYVAEDTFYVTPPSQYLGAVAKQNGKTGIGIINHYAVAKAKIEKTTKSTT